MGGACFGWFWTFSDLERLMIQFSLDKSAWLAWQGGRGSHWWETNCVWLVILCRWCHHRPPPPATPDVTQPKLFTVYTVNILFFNLSLSNYVSDSLSFVPNCTKFMLFPFLWNVKNSSHPVLWLESCNEGKVIYTTRPTQRYLDRISDKILCLSLEFILFW